MFSFYFFLIWIIGLDVQILNKDVSCSILPEMLWNMFEIEIYLSKLEINGCD